MTPEDLSKIERLLDGIESELRINNEIVKAAMRALIMFLESDNQSMLNKKISKDLRASVGILVRYK